MEKSFLNRALRAPLWILARTGLDLVFIGIMGVFLGVTLINSGTSLRIAQQSVLYPIGMMIFLLITRSLYWNYRKKQNKPEPQTLSTLFRQTLRDWIPFIVIDFIYENLHDLSKVFHTRDVAGTIMAIDIKIFGVELTQWSQRFFHPLLTDYMAFTYALYFIFPLLIMYSLSFQNKRQELQQIILALSIAFLLGFLGYVFFPCSPPRYFLEYQYTNPPRLYGYFIYNALQGKWDSLSAVRAGAFPSLHVGISSVALFFAFRFRKHNGFSKILFWIYVPLIISLWASTVYLRHHWFVDIMAGWTLALSASLGSPVLIKTWERFQKNIIQSR